MKMKVDQAKKSSYLKWGMIALLLLLLLFGYTPLGKSFWHAVNARFGMASFTAALSPDDLHVHIINVGKADAIYIEAPMGKVLLDCGTADQADTVLRYLRSRETDELDAVFISHADSDHAGGLPKISSALPVHHIYESPEGESIGKTLPPDENEKLSRVTVGERYTFGELTLDVLTPLKAYESANNNSMVLLLTYQNFSMLLCGDMEEKAENDFLEAYPDLTVDVLKVAHHGSDTSTGADFLAQIAPKYGVISVGEDKSDLPRNVVLKRMQDAGVSIYRTDQDGSVVFSTDGDRIQILSENKRSTK